MATPPQPDDDHKTPLLQNDVEALAVLDYKHPRTGSGGWRSAIFIIGKVSYDVIFCGFDFGFLFF